MVDTLEPRSTAITVVEAGAMIALNIISLLGNVLVCLSVYRNNRLRTDNKSVHDCIGCN